MVNNSLSSIKKLPEPLAYENHLSKLDNIKVPPVFSAARNALYTRYTPSDWSRHKKGISADMVRRKIRVEWIKNRLFQQLLYFIWKVYDFQLVSCYYEIVSLELILSFLAAPSKFWVFNNNRHLSHTFTSVRRLTYYMTTTSILL